MLQPPERLKLAQHRLSLDRLGLVSEQVEAVKTDWRALRAYEMSVSPRAVPRQVWPLACLRKPCSS